MAIGISHLHRINGKLACFREIEVIIKGSGGVRPQLCGATLGVVSILQGDGTFGHLHQKFKLLWRRSWIGDHYLTPVGNLLKKFILHKIIQPFVTHMTVSRIGAEKVLAQ